MKKLLLLFTILFSFGTSLWSNPRPELYMTFSELAFNENGQWTLELQFDGVNPAELDSIVLKTSGGSARVKLSLSQDKRLYILTSDSLSAPLSINRNGDSISVISYSMNNTAGQKNSLKFGSAPGALAGQPVDGYSIMSFPFEAMENGGILWFLTKSPSLGAPNDTTGQGVVLRGKIFDSNNELITGIKNTPQTGYYLQLVLPLVVRDNGTYSTKVFRRFNEEIVGHLTARLYDFTAWADTLRITPFKLSNIIPGTEVVQDIHMNVNNYTVSGVNESVPLPSSDPSIVNYPNPFNSSTNFLVKVPSGMVVNEGAIRIYNIMGQQVRTLPLTKEGLINWDGKDMHGNTVSSGRYFYHLDINKQTLKTGSMILLK